MNRLSAVLLTVLMAFLEKYLSGRTKRLVMITSFSARIKGQAALEQETLSKLNEVLAISHRESALYLPVLLNKAIWQGQSAVQIVGDEDYLAGKPADESRVRVLAARALQHVPRWLRYGDESQMQQDLVNVLGQRDLLAA